MVFGGRRWGAGGGGELPWISIPGAESVRACCLGQHGLVNARSCEATHACYFHIATHMPLNITRPSPMEALHARRVRPSTTSSTYPSLWPLGTFEAGSPVHLRLPWLPARRLPPLTECNPISRRTRVCLAIDTYCGSLTAPP